MSTVKLCFSVTFEALLLTIVLNRPAVLAGRGFHQGVTVIFWYRLVQQHWSPAELSGAV